MPPYVPVARFIPPGPVIPTVPLLSRHLMRRDDEGERSASTSVTAIAIVALLFFGALGTCVAGCWFYRKRMRRNREHRQQMHDMQMQNMYPQQGTMMPPPPQGYPQYPPGPQYPPNVGQQYPNQQYQRDEGEYDEDEYEEPQHKPGKFQQY